MINTERLGGLIFTLMLLTTLNCNSQPKPITDKAIENIKYKVTFVELGSVRCTPCQQMQAVLKSIEEKYEKHVKVVFHDVLTEEGGPYAKQYRIEAIPTQVFLDESGKEYYRHVGFFPEEELIEVLKMKDVK